MYFSLDLNEEFVAFKFYIRPPDPLKCIIEEGGSNSGRSDQGISH